MWAIFAQSAAEPFDLLVFCDAGPGPRRRSLHDVPAFAVAQRIGQRLDRLPNHPVRLPLVHFEGANLVDQLIDHVPEIERIEHAHAEVDRELQSRLAAGRLDAIRLLEEQYPEALKAGVLQREAVFRLVHAKAARAAGAGGEEDVIIDDLLARLSLLFQLLQVADQVADGKVSRIALAVVAELLARLKVRDHRGRNVLAAIAAAVEDGLDHLFVLPGEPAKEDGYVIAFRASEGALHRLLELAHARQSGLRAKARTFGIDAGLDFYFEVGLHDLVHDYRHGGSPVLRSDTVGVVPSGPVEMSAANGRTESSYIWPDIPWNPWASCLKKYLMTRWSL